MTSQPEADQVTGVVRSIAGELLTRCVYQSPGPAKKLAHDALLKKLGWFRQTRDGHANDAARQVLLCVATFHLDVFDELTELDRI